MIGETSGSTSIEVSTHNPAFHTGEVEGNLQLPENTAMCVQQTGCGGEVPYCRLTFARRPLFLHLEDDRYAILHGARAYCAGDYWKVQ